MSYSPPLQLRQAAQAALASLWPLVARALPAPLSEMDDQGIERVLGMLRRHGSFGIAVAASAFLSGLPWGQAALQAQLRPTRGSRDLGALHSQPIFLLHRARSSGMHELLLL